MILTVWTIDMRRPSPNRKDRAHIEMYHRDCLEDDKDGDIARIRRIGRFPASSTQEDQYAASQESAAKKPAPQRGCRLTITVKHLAAALADNHNIAKRQAEAAVRLGDARHSSSQEGRQNPPDPRAWRDGSRTVSRVENGHQNAPAIVHPIHRGMLPAPCCPSDFPARPAQPLRTHPVAPGQPDRRCPRSNAHTCSTTRPTKVSLHVTLGQTVNERFKIELCSAVHFSLPT